MNSERANKYELLLFATGALAGITIPTNCNTALVRIPFVTSAIWEISLPTNTVSPRHPSPTRLWHCSALKASSVERLSCTAVKTISAKLTIPTQRRQEMLAVVWLAPLSELCKYCYLTMKRPYFCMIVCLTLISWFYLFVAFHFSLFLLLLFLLPFSILFDENKSWYIYLLWP